VPGTAAASCETARSAAEHVTVSPRSPALPRGLPPSRSRLSRGGVQVSSLLRRAYPRSPAVGAWLSTVSMVRTDSVSPWSRQHAHGPAQHRARADPQLCPSSSPRHGFVRGLLVDTRGLLPCPAAIAEGITGVGGACRHGVGSPGGRSWRHGFAAPLNVCSACASMSSGQIAAFDQVVTGSGGDGIGVECHLGYPLAWDCKTARG
jgi:hypothetical protein